MSTMERLTVHASKALYKQQTLNHPKSMIFVIMLLLHTALTAFSNISLLAHSLCPASPLTTPIILSSRRCDECPRTLYDLFNRTPILPDDVTFQIFSHFQKFSLCCRFIVPEAIVSRSVKDRRIRESSISLSQSNLPTLKSGCTTYTNRRPLTYKAFLSVCPVKKSL